MVNVRKRDLTKPEKALSKSDIVQLERLISDVNEVDLTALERALRANKDEMDSIKALVAEKPTPPTYVFEVIRGNQNRVDKVIARPHDGATLLGKRELQ